MRRSYAYHLRVISCTWDTRCDMQVKKQMKGAVKYVVFFLLVTPRRQNFICRRFGTLCQFHPQRPCEHDESSCSHDL